MIFTLSVIFLRISQILQAITSRSTSALVNRLSNIIFYSFFAAFCINELSSDMISMSSRKNAFSISEIFFFREVLANYFMISIVVIKKPLTAYLFLKSISINHLGDGKLGHLMFLFREICLCLSN